MDTLQTGSLESLYSLFDELKVEGGWHRQIPALWREPRRNFLPYHWRYTDVRPALEAAGRLVDHSLAERRNLTMTNAVEGNRYATVRTLVAAYQLIRPGETARSHRHTPNALRIILEGHGAKTTVDGTRVDMSPGDVLLTPGWCWHSHECTGQEDCWWIDVLDVPLVQLLEPMFYEPHPDGIERDVVDAVSAPLLFRWEDSLATLEKAHPQPSGTAMAEREIELGKPALSTMALHMQYMGKSFASATHRTTANAVFAVLRGSGTTMVDGECFDWRPGDLIAIPAWRRYSHLAHESSYLVRTSDEPVMRSLNLLRSETTP